MELRQLRTFAAAAKLGSFTQAAQSLDMTQSAVSQQIAALSGELNVTLFERRGRGVRLTEAGARLSDYAIRIQELADEAVQVVSGTRADVAGTLRIATSTAPSEALLPELLAGFHSRWPLVRESLVVSDSTQAAADVQSGNADVGFVGQPADSTDLESEAVFDDEIVLVVNSRHAFANRRSATLKQIRSEPLIVRESGSGSRQCIADTLQAKGRSEDEFTIAMEANSNEMIRAAVRRGVGVAFISRSAVPNEKQLTTVSVRGFRPRRQLYVISPSKRPLQTPAREFLEFVGEWTSDRGER